MPTPVDRLTAATGKVIEEPEEPDESPRRLRPLLIGGLLALIAAAVAVALLASGGDGDGGRTVGETSADTTNQEVKEKKPDPKPRTLTEAQLIAQGDAICTDSRTKFTRVRDPLLEEVPDVSYAKQLVNISTEAVQEFNRLKPPPKLERSYRNFVASQEQVNQWDIDALRASEEEDEVAYREAREDRNDTEDDRKALAEEVGFKECGGSDL
jgi:hypothetical protein